MTNYNERLDEIFYQYGRQVAESAVDDDRYDEDGNEILEEK